MAETTDLPSVWIVVCPDGTFPSYRGVSFDAESGDKAARAVDRVGGCSCRETGHRAVRYDPERGVVVPGRGQLGQ
ncbi:MAG: hypothetical protein ABIL09_24035 [Gemmatimonadota bacterium]